MSQFQRTFDIHGAEVKIVEWAELYFSVQVPCKQFDMLMEHLTDHNDFEKFLKQEVSHFYALKEDIMEVVIPTNTELYRWLVEEKKKQQ